MNKQNITLESKINIFRFGRFAVLFIMFVSVVSSCSQSLDDVTILRKNPVSSAPSSFKFYRSNMDLTGAATSMPSSASVRLTDHSAGGVSQTTKSASASFKMVGGVGLQ